MRRPVGSLTVQEAVIKKGQSFDTEVFQSICRLSKENEVPAVHDRQSVE
jgi:hypothetical protein